MHRSGTSALAGLFVRLGVTAPATLMLPSEHNPLGFWESVPFAEFNDRLLAIGGTAWDRWTPAVWPDMSVPSRVALEGEFARLLQTEFGGAPLFVVKDPRICKLLAFWLRGLADNGVDVAPVLILRSPYEVARSLARRDGHSLPHALLLWLRYALDAEVNTRGMRRSVIQYGDLLADWQLTAQRVSVDTGIAWPDLSGHAVAEASSFLTSELRHHVVESPNETVAPQLLEWVEQTWSALSDLARGAAGTALGRLDVVRASFNAACELFHDRAAEAREARIQSLELELDECHRELTRLQESHRSLTGQIVAFEHEWEAQETERARLFDECANAAARIEALIRQSAKTEFALTARITALEQSRTWRWTAPIRAAAAFSLGWKSRHSD